MINETLNRLSREMRSFYSLIIMNMVGAGLAVAMGMAFTVRNVHLMMEARKLIWPEALMVALVVAGGLLVFRWFLTGAEMMDEYQDVRDEDGNGAEESATELIVKNIAFYRDHKGSMGSLIIGSLITGAYFLLSATMQVSYLLSVISSGTPFEMVFSLVGFSLCLVLGVVGVYVSHMFKRYEDTWDRRLQESMEAEKRLGELLEGSS